MPYLALTLALCIAQPLAAQTLAHDPGTGESWVVRDAQMPVLRPVLPADGRGELPAALPSATHRLRVQKAQRIVGTFYGSSGFLPYCEILVATHERLEREHNAEGFGACWYWSLVYGGANFGLQVGGVAPGSCAGPMDVKRFPLVTDPVENIEYHCREMLGFYKRGVRGRDLCESVFLPARPRDWGGGRFARTDRRFREYMAEGYRVGKLK